MAIKKRMVCPECGTDDVWCNAQVFWDEDKQEWDLEDVWLYEGWCNRCDMTIEPFEKTVCVTDR